MLDEEHVLASLARFIKPSSTRPKIELPRIYASSLTEIPHAVVVGGCPRFIC
jgi:hypothetical protein